MPGPTLSQAVRQALVDCESADRYCLTALQHVRTELTKLAGRNQKPMAACAQVVQQLRQDLFGLPPTGRQTCNLLLMPGLLSSQVCRSRLLVPHLEVCAGVHLDVVAAARLGTNEVSTRCPLAGGLKAICVLLGGDPAAITENNGQSAFDAKSHSAPGL